MDNMNVENEGRISKKGLELIEYIRALSAYKAEEIELSVGNEDKSIFLYDIPNFSHSIYNSIVEDCMENILVEDDNKVILEVKKVNRVNCPAPSIEIQEMLVQEWKKIK